MHLVVVSHACVTDINQQVYAEIERLGHKVDIIVPSNFIAPGLAKTPIKVKRWSKFGGRIIEIPIIFNKSIPLHFYIKSLKKILKECRPDAVYVSEEPYSISCYQAIKSALPHAKAVGFYSAQNIKKDYPFLIKKMEKFVYANSALAISISSDVTQVLRDKGYEHQISEIPLGVDENHFTISYKWRKEMRTQLNIPENAFIIGYAGRIVKEKGIDILLKAFRTINQNDHQVYLVLVGRGPLLVELKRQVNEHGICQNVKFVDDANHIEMPKWFNIMDVHVLPSKTMPNWREQFGRVLIEAAACGVPTIGSSSGEIPKVLNSMGMNMIFPEGNIEQLTHELIKIRRDKINPAFLRKKAISRYGNKGIASQLISSFEKVI